MADYFAAKIEIGGQISKALAEELAAIIFNEEMTIGYGHQPFTCIEAVREYIHSGEVLVFRDDQARYGTFTELEMFLDAYNIDYDRHSDGYAEIDAQNFYRRGKNPYCFDSNQSEHDLIRADDVRKLVKEAIEDGSPNDALETFYYGLRELVPDIPVLEPILVIEND